MEGSSEVLLVGGTLVLLFGMVLGIPMAQARMKSATAPRHLVNTHVEGLIAGASLLGLSLASSYSTLGDGLEKLAAWLIVAGAASTLIGGTLNWRLDIDDPFAARSPGFYFQAVGGPVLLVGAILLTIGVLKAV